MIITALDTSGPTCSCALWQDGKILASINVNRDREHSKILMPLIEELYSLSKLKPSETDYFVTNKGPGSFTGLRIGMSAIKGMAKALNKKTYSFDTFIIQSEALSHFKGYILVLEDALRKTFYSTLFSNKDGKMERILEDGVRTIDEIKDLLKDYKEEEIIVTGSALVNYSKEIRLSFPGIVMNNSLDIYPDAKYLISLCLKAIENNIGPDDCLPYYMRKPQAERELEEKKLREAKKE